MTLFYLIMYYINYTYLKATFKTMEGNVGEGFIRLYLIAMSFMRYKDFHVSIRLSMPVYVGLYKYNRH